MKTWEDYQRELPVLTAKEAMWLEIEVLRAANVRLTAERDALHKNRHAREDVISGLRDDIEKISAEHDALLAANHDLQDWYDAAQADAKRYRWLRDEAQWLDNVPQAIIWDTAGPGQNICAEDDLDAAIDKAMGEQS